MPYLNIGEIFENMVSVGGTYKLTSHYLDGKKEFSGLIQTINASKDILEKITTEILTKRLKTVFKEQKFSSPMSDLRYDTYTVLENDVGFYAIGFQVLSSNILPKVTFYEKTDLSDIYQIMVRTISKYSTVEEVLSSSETTTDKQVFRRKIMD